MLGGMADRIYGDTGGTTSQTENQKKLNHEEHKDKHQTKWFYGFFVNFVSFVVTCLLLVRGERHFGDSFI